MEIGNILLYLVGVGENRRSTVLSMVRRGLVRVEWGKYEPHNELRWRYRLTPAGMKLRAELEKENRHENP